MPDTFESLRPFLADHLRGKGIDPRKRFRCLNPEHYDRSLSQFINIILKDYLENSDEREDLKKVFSGR